MLTYLQRQMDTVAEMHSFQQTVRRLLRDSDFIVDLGKCHYAPVGDRLTFNQANSPKLWKGSELLDAGISQPVTAC